MKAKWLSWADGDFMTDTRSQNDVSLEALLSRRVKRESSREQSSAVSY